MRGRVADGERGLTRERLDRPLPLGEEVEEFEARGAREAFADARELRVELILEFAVFHVDFSTHPIF